MKTIKFILGFIKGFIKGTYLIIKGLYIAKKMERAGVEVGDGYKRK